MGKLVSADPADFSADPDDFYVPSPGRDGVPIATRVTYETVETITNIVQSGKLRYRNNGDFVRAAIHRFIERDIAPKMGKRFQCDIRLSAQLARNAMQLERLADFEKTLAKVRSSLLVMARTDVFAEDMVDLWDQAMVTARRMNRRGYQKLIEDKLNNDPELAAARKIIQDYKATHAPNDEEIP